MHCTIYEECIRYAKEQCSLAGICETCAYADEKITCPECENDKKDE